MSIQAPREQTLLRRMESLPDAKTALSLAASISTALERDSIDAGDTLKSPLGEEIGRLERLLAQLASDVDPDLVQRFVENFPERTRTALTAESTPRSEETTQGAAAIPSTATELYASYHETMCKLIDVEAEAAKIAEELARVCQGGRGTLLRNESRFISAMEKIQNSTDRSTLPRWIGLTTKKAERTIEKFNQSLADAWPFDGPVPETYRLRGVCGESTGVLYGAAVQDVCSRHWAYLYQRERWYYDGEHPTRVGIRDVLPQFSELQEQKAALEAKLRLELSTSREDRIDAKMDWLSVESSGELYREARSLWDEIIAYTHSTADRAIQGEEGSGVVGSVHVGTNYTLRCLPRLDTLSRDQLSAIRNHRFITPTTAETLIDRMLTLSELYGVMRKRFGDSAESQELGELLLSSRFRFTAPGGARILDTTVLDLHSQIKELSEEGFYPQNRADDAFRRGAPTARTRPQD